MLFERLARGVEDKGDAEVVNEEKMSQVKRWGTNKGGKKKEHLFVKGSRPQDARAPLASA